MGNSTTVPDAGALDLIPLERVITSLAELKASGRVCVYSGDSQGSIAFDQGRVAGAEFRDQQGDEALVHLIALTVGRYEIIPQPASSELGGADSRLNSIIVEAQKRRARLESLSQAVGGLERVLHVDVQRLRQQLEQIPDEVNPVLNLCDGRRSVAEILRASSFGDITTLRILERLTLMAVVTDAQVPEPAGEATGLDDAPAASASAPAPVEIPREQVADSTVSQDAQEHAASPDEAAQDAATEVQPAQAVDATPSSDLEARSDLASDSAQPEVSLPVSEPETSTEPGWAAPPVASTAIADGPSLSPSPDAAADTETVSEIATQIESPIETKTETEIETKIATEAVEPAPGAEPVSMDQAPSLLVDAAPATPAAPVPVDVGEVAPQVETAAPEHGAPEAAPPAETVDTSELRLYPAVVDGGKPPAVAMWQTEVHGETPVVARWTNFPPEPPPHSAFEEYGPARSSANSLAAALGGEASGSTDEGFENWLDAEEAGFFERAVSETFEYETAASRPRGRDLFPFVLGVTFVGLVVIGVGLYLWRSSQPPPAAGSVSLGEVVVQETQPFRAPGRPVIIPADDELKVQSPYEAVVESARGAEPAKVDTVLQPDTPVVTVLRDVEGLVPEARAPEELPTPPSAETQPQEEAPPVHDATPAAGTGVPVPTPPDPPLNPPPAAEASAAAAVAPEDGGKTFAQLYAEGTRLLKRERYKQALAKFEAAMIKDPGDARVYLSIGQIYFEFGNIHSAIKHYRKAEALAPRNPRVHLLMGLALHEAGKLQDARTHYQRYLELDPEGTEAPAVRGILATLPR
ncbi:MAG: tetratricopeptide repeat protein [Pseudomonadota bacterium]